MSIKIIVPVKVATNSQGIGKSKQYYVGDELPIDEDWQKELAQQLIEAGMAEETKVVAPTEVKKAKKKKG